MKSYYKSRDMGRTVAVRSWTNLAINCYKRGCTCNGCIYSEVLESCKCHMKATVLELVRVLGVPNYTEVTNTDGSTDYIIHNSKHGYHQNKKNIFEDYEDYISTQTAYVVKNEISGVSQSNLIIAALFIEGNSRDEVCMILNKKRDDVNSRLSSIYIATQAKVQYKTAHKKLEEFVKFYRKKIQEYSEAI